MVKKLYVCRECSYVFPEELSELIENKVQVFCEMCGTPFTLAGVEFKRTSDKFQERPDMPYPRYGITKKEKSGLSEAIKTLNKLSSIPLIIFSGIVLGLSFTTYYSSILGENWIINLFVHLIIGFSAILIVIYDLNYISPKIREEKYDEIALDAFCYGILGCIIFGTGVILLIKGVLILIHVAFHSERPEHKIYDFGIKLKNSINNFSAKAGFVIIFLVIWSILIGEIDINSIVEGFYFIQGILATLEDWLQLIIIIAIVAIFCLFPVILLLIDLKWKKKIRKKQIFTFGDALRVFIVGIICSTFFGIGIFILLKGILIFFLFVGKPIDATKAVVIGVEKEEQEKEKFISTYKVSEKSPKEKIEEKELEFKEPETLQKEPEKAYIREKVETKKPVSPEKVEEKVEEIFPKDEIVEKKIEEKDTKLRLHESLLPVRDEKDKKLVKEYFSKIFNVLSKNIREQILALEIPKKDKKELLKELAFLTEVEQAKYIEAISILYREIPQKLIQRIRKLKNVKPQYYDKIVEQLKFMDIDEQIEFVRFLEDNA
ncbi:MAG: hypothetical protein ACFE8J_09785 [Candidatus Heimdallarchaeota archaeon]